jgi:Tol biopolymer transport system component
MVKKLAYVDLAEGVITVMNSDGSEPVKVAEWKGKGDITRLAWSPDSTRLVYIVMVTAESETPLPQLRRVNADGSGDRELAFWDVVLSEQQPELAWSPNGRWILVYASMKETPRAIQPFAFRSDGSNYQILAKTSMDAPASWSPDSQRVAYYSLLNPGDLIPSLTLYSLNGSHKTIGMTAYSIDMYHPVNA